MTMINAGVASNAVPESLTCTISIRHTESFSETLLKNMCAHILKKYDATVEQEAYG
jgi:acetylornithine deacetylase/succinyl-diaminopimelate desuccinylase-like protein